MTEAQRLAEWLDIFSHQTMHPLPITKAAAELRRLDKLCAEWEAKAATWLASPEAAQRLDGYRELAQQVNRLDAKCEQLRADAARLAYLLKDDSEWGLCVFDHDAGYWVHDARAPDVVRADIDWAMKETK